VVSDSTAALLRGVMPEETELRDLGEHRLKDLVEAEHVWQLFAPGLGEAFPPLRSLESLPNNLPRQMTPLIGREDVLAELEPLVLEHPLVSLVGTGGIGKTRLALQAGADLLDGSGDGVWFVELAPLSGPSMLVNTIASTFGLREQPSRPMLDVLLQYLRPRRLLLILDNCEHLIEEAARVADAILCIASDVRILATSREPLRITAESVYRVPSLTIPSGDSLTSQEALNYGAIALFAERAAASDTKFKLTDESVPTVAEICRRLDGIALAIELAAARVKIFSPRELAQRLDERFRVLTGGSRTALPRQQTMRALIDWSYGLLSEREQRLLRRVAVFVDGWTLEAAEEVSSDERLDAQDILDVMSSLVEKSLVIAEANEDRTRYRLLESTRAFALEKLEQSGEGDALARRHAQWAADLADRANEAWLADAGPQWLAQRLLEFENARAAINWALLRGEVILAARAAAGFAGVYRYHGRFAELRVRLEEVLARLDADAQPELATRTWIRLFSVSPLLSRAIEAAQRALELSERCNAPALAVWSLSWLAIGLAHAGRLEDAQAAVDRAVRITNESSVTPKPICVEMLNAAGTVAFHCSRFDEALQFYGEALALGDEIVATAIQVSMSEIEYVRGNAARALELVSPIKAKAGPFFIRVNACIHSIAYQIAVGNIAQARIDARDALRLVRGISDGTLSVIEQLATVAALDGDPSRGARLRGYVDAWYRNEGSARGPSEARSYEVLMAALRKNLTDAEIETLAAEGAQLSEDQAIAVALSL
ncbi:MAG: hypothetical protein JO104_04435, partial [Candidatus Eremiobacteraeota bacterium]|nr:hypothetical protein [Candidatus Eremiobacteraeota bacterium]